MKKQEIPAWPLLGPMLRLAVPMWIQRHRGMRQKDLQARASACATIIGSQGDSLLFGNVAKPRRGTLGKCGEAFNAMAEGMACAVLLDTANGPAHLEQLLANIERVDTSHGTPS